MLSSPSSQTLTNLYKFWFKLNIFDGSVWLKLFVAHLTNTSFCRSTWTESLFCQHTKTKHCFGFPGVIIEQFPRCPPWILYLLINQSIPVLRKVGVVAPRRQSRADILIPTAAAATDIRRARPTVSIGIALKPPDSWIQDWEGAAATAPSPASCLLLILCCLSSVNRCRCLKTVLCPALRCGRRRILPRPPRLEMKRILSDFSA